MRPAFSSGVLELPKHVPYVEPETTTEWAPQRRPMQLNEAPAPRSKNYELLRQIERQEMLKSLVTEKGLKIDSDLNTKLFDIRVRDPLTGVMTDRSVSLAEAVTLPINDRIALLEQAVLAKGISPADLTSLQAIIANNTRQLVLETLTRDQLAAVQRLVIKLGKPADYKEATLDRFHDAETVDNGKGLIQLFLLGQTPVDAAGNPVDFVTVDTAGTTIPIADVLTYLQADPSRILDLDSKSIIDSANAQALSPADYNKLTSTKAALAPASNIPPPAPPAPASNIPPPPPLPTPPRRPPPSIPPTIVPPPSKNGGGSVQILKVHVRDIDEAWPDPNSIGRRLLETWNATTTQEAKGNYYAPSGNGKRFVDIGEENRYNNILKAGRIADVDWRSAAV